MKDCGNKVLDIEIFGESHSDEIGVKIKGIPIGTPFDRGELAKFMARRAPGSAGAGAADGDMVARLASAASTPRKEMDEVEFREGVEILTETCVVNGEEIVAVIRNRDVRSQDYDELRKTLRPGHADMGAYLKYGREGLRPGGGRFSGRMTAPLCIAGGIAKQYLEGRGITIEATITEIAGEQTEEEMLTAIENAKREKDSVGGIIRCTVTGFPAGIGGALFDGIESALAHAIFAVPAVKGLEFGSGFSGSRMMGSENNDEIFIDGKDLVTKTNNHGGITGGISTGMDIVFNVALKPTPTIGCEQRTVDISVMEERVVSGTGRHDACIVPRAVPVVEAAAALALLGKLLEETGA